MLVCNLCGKAIQTEKPYIIIRCLKERKICFYHKQCFLKALKINFTEEDLLYFIEFKTDIDEDWEE